MSELYNHSIVSKAHKQCPSKTPKMGREHEKNARDSGILTGIGEDSQQFTDQVI